MSTAPELEPTQVAQLGARLRDNIARAVKAPSDVIRDVLVAQFAEGHVLIEDYPGVGKTALARALARPFIVVATQNPVEYEGTYPLPEAQLDRFMVRVSLGYPSADQESQMLMDHAESDRVLDLETVADVGDVLAAQTAAGAVHGSEALRRYVVSILDATRADPRVDLGASPRAGLMLFRAAKALAALDGRDHALPDDVQKMSAAVLSHRLLLAPGTGSEERDVVVRDALERVPAL